MILPTPVELRAAIAAHLADPNEQASAASIARVVSRLLHTAETDAERCPQNGCPHARVNGLETCAEHAAQEIALLRTQLREGVSA